MNLNGIITQIPLKPKQYPHYHYKMMPSSFIHPVFRLINACFIIEYFVMNSSKVTSEVRLSAPINFRMRFLPTCGRVTVNCSGRHKFPRIHYHAKRNEAKKLSVKLAPALGLLGPTCGRPCGKVADVFLTVFVSHCSICIHLFLQPKCMSAF